MYRNVFFKSINHNGYKVTHNQCNLRSLITFLSSAKKDGFCIKFFSVDYLLTTISYLMGIQSRVSLKISVIEISLCIEHCAQLKRFSASGFL